MKTVNKDLELEVELQEVYLTSKQWLSDVKFLEDEGHFLEEQLSANAVASSIAVISRCNLADQVRNAQIFHAEIKKEVDGFMHRIEALIVQPDPVLNLRLLEDYIGLQAKVEQALSMLKGIKYALLEARRIA